ncbi:uncharacterized protein LOC111819771 [Trichechus manatus latirostris]|uniref:Uncharacterized protein LOC111819771 n=1 Tax=Trichechus manatus latirostris TaxID=127582 RepID=A0A2Y9QVY9_TRIMA|nr:uncharacterized protein LOC111819771 [Trichechus manatus latirostris]XP_023583508.1 uncharacterized protein LOC111819771 [Trichechus manatus latirostris]XP_023583509.1 uncharacterized protein LOC111819771 [Trichechus manatus latirostris]XP_023583510.1 uncharacterized protein LOC111819771 [Trichechus manatus latirostris]
MGQSVLLLLLGPLLSVVAQPWKDNLLVHLSDGVVHGSKLSDCWICHKGKTEGSRHGPLFKAIPVNLSGIDRLPPPFPKPKGTKIITLQVIPSPVEANRFGEVPCLEPADVSWWSNVEPATKDFKRPPSCSPVVADLIYLKNFTNCNISHKNGNTWYEIVGKFNSKLTIGPCEPPGENFTMMVHGSQATYKTFCPTNSSFKVNYTTQAIWRINETNPTCNQSHNYGSWKNWIRSIHASAWNKSGDWGPLRGPRSYPGCERTNNHFLTGRFQAWILKNPSLNPNNSTCWHNSPQLLCLPTGLWFLCRDCSGRTRALSCLNSTEVSGRCTIGWLRLKDDHISSRSSPPVWPLRVSAFGKVCAF